MQGILDIVVGGQFGSEGKGAVGAHLAKGRCDIAVRVAGPNAGHSAYDAQGRKWALRQIPVAAVVNLGLDIVLGAGSEIDPTVLADEVRSLEAAGIPILDRLHIDRHATVIRPEHIEAEGGYGGELTQRLGSTGKGIGAARSDRIWRKAEVWGEGRPIPGIDFCSMGWGTDTAAMLRSQLRRGARVMLEGTQGYGLGLHTEFYPQCTSSDCRAVDFAAMAGITPWADCRVVNTWIATRTYPIRVAGNSGPLGGETSWAKLSEATGGYIQPEKTTVTQVERRVGEFDSELVRAAVDANGGGDGALIALTFFDYWYPELAGETSTKALGQAHRDRIRVIEESVHAPVRLVGTGPDSMIELF